MRKLRSEWKMWAVGFGLALVILPLWLVSIHLAMTITPIFIAWRLHALFGKVR